MTTYKSVVTGATVTVPTYQSGCHNMIIENNTFDIEEGSDKRLFNATMESTKIGAKYASNIMIADAFDARPTRFSGYVDYFNTLGNVTFAKNTINISGQPNYTNQFFTSMNTVNLKIEDNTFNLAEGVSFSASSDGIEGAFIRSNATAESAYSRYIEMQRSNSFVSVCDAEGNELFKVRANATATLTLASDGNGSITTRCEGGNVIVTVTPNEGYEFDGWSESGDLNISAATTVTATFKK